MLKKIFTECTKLGSDGFTADMMDNFNDYEFYIIDFVKGVKKAEWQSYGEMIEVVYSVQNMDSDFKRAEFYYCKKNKENEMKKEKPKEKNESPEYSDFIQNVKIETPKIEKMILNACEVSEYEIEKLEFTKEYYNADNLMESVEISLKITRKARK